MAIKNWQLQIWESFLRAHHRLIAQLDRELRQQHDLPLEWYDVLLQLHNAGGHRKMGELAEAVLITAPNCTRLVDRMEQAGLVERTVDPDDRRARLAAITSEGTAMLRRAAPTHLAGIERYFTSQLPSTQSAAQPIGQLLSDAVAALDHVVERPGTTS
jgi:DNA-binding MarR family transcriptional regulator